MSIDLFVVSGSIGDIKGKILVLEKMVMEEPNPDDINWERVMDLADGIRESAETLYDEVDEGYNDCEDD